MMKIAVASGKGGTGKTLVATNLFDVLNRNHYKVCLVDCDAEAPNACAFFDLSLKESTEVTQLVPVIDTGKCTFCGKCHEYCSYNAIFILPPFRIIQVLEDMCHGCGACIQACDYGAITEKPVSLGKVNRFTTMVHDVTLIESRTNVGVMSPVPLIKAAVRQIDPQELIVILDSPPGTSCPFIQTSSAANYVILVTEPTPFGLSDLRKSVETLKKIRKPFGVILNRDGMGDQEVEKYLLAQKIPLLMKIPFKKEIAMHYSRGEILAQHDKDFEESIFSLADEILKNFGNSSN